jgi:hypothetical protein
MKAWLGAVLSMIALKQFFCYQGTVAYLSFCFLLAGFPVCCEPFALVVVDENTRGK